MQAIYPCPWNYLMTVENNKIYGRRYFDGRFDFKVVNVENKEDLEKRVMLLYSNNKLSLIFSEYSKEKTKKMISDVKRNLPSLLKKV